jgi:hypothetical protein
MQSQVCAPLASIGPWFLKKKRPQRSGFAYYFWLFFFFFFCFITFTSLQLLCEGMGCIYSTQEAE